MPNFKTLNFKELVDIQEVGYNAALKSKSDVTRELFLHIAMTAREELELRNK